MTNIEIDSDLSNNDTVVNRVALYTEGDEMDYVPFSEDMSKDEMVDHIINVHGHQGDIAGKAFHAYGTKVTKADMIAWHESAHAILDEPDLTVTGLRNGGMVLVATTPAYQNKASGRHWLDRTSLPKIRHNHRAIIPVSDNPNAKRVREGKKTEGVLSATERKVLTQVVDNDFGSLKQEMRAFASDALMQRKKEIEAEWDAKEKALPDFATQATEAMRVRDEKARALKAKFNADIRALDESYQDQHRQVVAQAKGKGVTLEGKDERYHDEHGQAFSRTVFVASIAGRKEAVAAAEKENQAYLDRALMDLERQRLTAQRQVLLSGVPEGAMTILDNIPDAKTLMVESQKQSNANQIESSSKS